MNQMQKHPPIPTLITYSNYGYIHFAINLIVNVLRKIKHHKLHFYCLDEEIYEKLKKMDINSENIIIELFKPKLKKEIEKNFTIYGSEEYNKITHTKISVIRDALEKYNFIHFIDCDVVCINEPPVEYYKKYKDYDIMFQYDAGFEKSSTSTSDDLIPIPHSFPILNHIWACTGNTTFRNTPQTKKILNIIEGYQNKYPNKNDQECLYQYFIDLQIKDMIDCKDAIMGTYPYEEYTNGFWLNNNIGNLSKTYFFHANHVTGMNAKIELLNKAGEWHIHNF